VNAPPLERIEADERALVFDGCTRDDAWELGCLLRAAAVGAGHGLSIGVALNGQWVFGCVLDGATADNDLWLRRKAATALHYQRSSLGVAAWFAERGLDFDTDSRLPADGHAARGGAFPIRTTGAGTVGVVSVSGLPHVEDHAFVVAQLRAHLGR